jgi:hypothetical protein
VTLLDRLPTPSRRVPARLAAFAVALVGALLLLAALAQVTVWATPAHTVVRVAGQSGKPIVVTTPAALALDGPSVRVSVRAAHPTEDVFVGIGRGSDVEAYLGNVARTEVTGVRGSDAVQTSAGSEAALPEPAGVDVWALAMTGRGSASLVWPRADGSWRMVAAVDGATPPAEVVIDWERQRGSALTPALFGVGGLLLVLGLVGVRATRRRDPAVAGAPAFGSPVEDDQEDDAHVEESPAPFRSEHRS